MILGVGIDIVEVERMARILDRHGERFTRRCFTDAEVQYCNGMARRAEHFAARFAAKEAAVKALGTGVAEGVRLRDIEVTRDAAGKPSLRLAGGALGRFESMGGRVAHVTLTHSALHAAAVVILEGGVET